jgi:Zn-dependent peptidase ImmA (M78 family)
MTRTVTITREGQLAQALRETLQLPPHVDLNELARELKLSVIEAESDSFDGALLCSRNRLSGRILVKRSMREVGRKRFTIAHEIGHFILHRENQISCLPSDIAGWSNNSESPERQADSFASELLLPSAHVLREIGDTWPSFELVVALANSFGASLTATARKYCELAPQECAVVWSVEGIVRWIHPASRFRHFVGMGRELSDQTIARKMLNGEDVLSGMQEVPAEAWISDFRLPQGATIWEESRTMPFYRGCLTLLWAKRDIRYRDSGEEELLQELDPHEFTHERTIWPTKGKRRR